jgi:predicted RNase H-like HicB family nuclease
MTGVNQFDGVSFTLNAEERADGSYFIDSPELPFFSAIGIDEREALKNALCILDPYFAANIPEYVDLKRARDISDVMYNTSEKRLFPAHMIAVRGDTAVGCQSE